MRKTISAYVDMEIRNKLEEVALKNGCALSKVVEDALKHYIDALEVL